MIYRTRIPAPPLARLIDHLWFFSGYVPSFPRERILPDASAELVINLQDVPRKLFDEERPGRHRLFRRAWLSGPESGPIVIDALPRSSLMGAHFKPGGVAAFLAEPVDEVSDRVLELDLLWGASASDLRDQLLEAETPDSKLQALERFLVGRFRPARVDPLVARALEVLDGAPPGSRVEPLAETLGFSHKQFVARFRRSVGLPPKLYSRLLRFQGALRAIPPEGAVRWAEVALDCGYYDQAHFNRDFRAFSGMTPLEYLSLRGDEARFVPEPE